MTAPTKPVGTPLKSATDLIPDDTGLSTPSPTLPTSPQPSPVTKGAEPPVKGASVISPTDYEKIQEELAQAQRVIDSQNAVLKDQNQLLAQQPPTAPSTPEPAAIPAKDDSTEFWSDPAGKIRDMIKDEIKTISLPLNQQIAESKIGLLKQAISAEYGEAYAQMEPYIDSIISQALAQGTEVSKAVIDFAAAAAYGNLMKAGVLTATAPAPAPTPPIGDPTVTVPHMRPSAPPAPIPGKEPSKLRPLTENEARLARENKLSHAEYLAWIAEDSDNVASSKIGTEGWEENK